jgi:hypothetical protein
VTGARLSEKKEKKKKKKKKTATQATTRGAFLRHGSRPLKMDWHISLVYIRKESESMSVP